MSWLSLPPLPKHHFGQWTVVFDEPVHAVRFLHHANFEGAHPRALTSTRVVMRTTVGRIDALADGAGLRRDKVSYKVLRGKKP